MPMHPPSLWFLGVTAQLWLRSNIKMQWWLKKSPRWLALKRKHSECYPSPHPVVIMFQTLAGTTHTSHWGQEGSGGEETKRWAWCSLRLLWNLKRQATTSILTLSVYPSVTHCHLCFYIIIHGLFALKRRVWADGSLPQRLWKLKIASLVDVEIL